MAVLKAQRAKKSDRNDADNEDDAGRIAEASASEDTGIQQKQMLLESRKLLLEKAAGTGERAPGARRTCDLVRPR
ncbi:MAG: hypothetical protein ACJ8AH_15625 [Stellaceae bacterium]